MLSLGSKVKELVDNFRDVNSPEDFLDFFPGHGPHFWNVGQAVGNQEFPYVEVEAALSVRIEAGSEWSKVWSQSGAPALLCD
jgi:hypothetical protein